MSSGIQTIDWPSLKSGTTIQMKDFPSVKLLKLDNTTGLYYGYDDKNVIVNVKEYTSESNGHYYYFQIGPDDWHPLTARLWRV